MTLREKVDRSKGTLKRQDSVWLDSSVNTSLVSVLGLTQLDLFFLSPSRLQVIKSLSSVSQRAVLLINASCGVLS